MNLKQKFIMHLSKYSFVQFSRDIIFMFKKYESYAQHGEDLFISSEIFSNADTGTYLDIGASHPARLSNTYLMYKKGWTGFLVEPIPTLAKKLKHWRPRDKVFNCAVGSDNRSITFYKIFPSVLSTTSRSVANRIEKEGTGKIVSNLKLSKKQYGK